MEACFEGEYGIGPLTNYPLHQIPPLPIVHDLMEADPVVLLFSIPRACSWDMLEEGELTFTPGLGVKFTDDISGKSDSESNQLVRGASSESINVYCGS